MKEAKKTPKQLLQSMAVRERVVEAAKSMIIPSVHFNVTNGGKEIWLELRLVRPRKRKKTTTE